MFEEICGVLVSEAEAFAKKYNAKVLPLEKIYKNQRPAIAATAIEFTDFSLILKYVAGSFMGPKSVLIGCLYKSGDPMPLAYTFYDVFPFLGVRDFRPTQFSFVSDKEDALCAIKAILEVTEDRFEGLCTLFSSPEQLRELRLFKNAQIKEQMSDDVFETANELEFGEVREDYLKKALGMYEIMELTRYSTARYSMFLEGDYNRSKRKYLKEKHKTPYEAMMLEYMLTSPEPEKYLNFIENADTASSGKRVVIPLILLVLFVLTPLFSVLYLLLYGAFATVFEAGAVYNSAFELYNAANAVLPAFITSIALSYFFRRVMIRIFRRKTREKELAYDAVANPRSVVSFMKYFLYTVVVMSVIGCMLFANTNISFYDNKIVDNGGLFQLSGKEYRYSDIVSAQESGGIVNDFGDWVEGEHLVITFRNGDVLDTYFYADLVNIRRLVYPILEEHGIQMQTISGEKEVK